MPNEHLTRIQTILLQGKTWRYLRYIHFRDYLARVSSEVETVCVVGAGYGYAELACAVEFPHIRFTLTDIIATGYPNYHRTMALAWNWSIENINFSVWNVLQPTERQFDVVASTEMIEHVPNVPRAVQNMRAAALKYVYCLAPFSDDATNADPVKRRHAWQKCEHLVFGFDRKSLESLFGEAIDISGTYWRDAGLPFRQKLTGMRAEEIEANAASLKEEAARDVREGVPQRLTEAIGIKILSRANAPIPNVPILPPPLEKVIQ
jgi:hypothetical protein